ncbi:helix-turn-helix domain-containing protein [Geoalkalibacter halelectricus]|uniref:helix-turn-helix domain-containing protein n=1 Tax=Geoalkalibacter halelectricus TaxID=2847045 RepID=UPI0026708CF5|nr:helix-turn-helix transcriptional regulator [Geoalkalibacter halelectricus]MDO3380367.1 helix-turn-helix domain-containing protein [Geoalkalibacter halelectricus]
MTGLGELIRKIRADRTLAEFAAEYGIHPNTVSKYEKELAFPSMEFVVHLLQKEDVSPNEFFNWQGPSSIEYRPEVLAEVVNALVELIPHSVGRKTGELVVYGYEQAVQQKANSADIRNILLKMIRLIELTPIHERGVR